jgi:hypothetical protein
MSDVHAADRGLPWLALSCEYLFYQAKQRDGTPAQEGTTMSAARAALEHDGQPLETGWPYLTALPADLKLWRPPLNVGTIHRRQSEMRGHAFAQVWDAVEADRPTVIGMTLSTAFFLPDGEGVVDSGEPSDPNLRHALVAVATGNRAKERLVLVRNSWGGKWGLSGYAWLAERYATTRIFVAVTIT